MKPSALSTRWGREWPVGRAVWQVLGAVFSLWAWFGWLAPWFAGLMPRGNTGLLPGVPLLILGAALLGHGSAWVADRVALSRLSAASMRLVLLLAILGTAWWAFASGPAGVGLSSWQATWIVIATIAYPWWRGGSLSSGEVLDPEVTLRRLFAGVLLASAAFVLLPRAAGLGQAFLPSYLGGGLAGVALGQVSDASRRRGGRPLPFGVRWYAALLLVVMAAVVLGLLLAEMLRSDAAWSLADGLVRSMAGAARILGSFLRPIVEAIFRLIGPVFDAFIRLLQSLLEGAGETELTITQPPLFGAEELGEAEPGNEFLARLGVVLRLLATVVGAAALLWMAIRTTGRARRAVDDREPEMVEDVPDQGSARSESGLRRFLRSALRLPGKARSLYHAMLVRRVYAQLLEWAEEQGRPRRPAETPLELGAALGLLLPQRRADLEEITQAYLRVRYGEVPEDSDMVDRVLAAWERVRRTESRLLPAKERNSR